MTWAELNEFDKAKDDLEKALELAELANDTDHMESIPRILSSIAFQIDEVDQLTPDMFKELVPGDISEHYDTQVGDEELYKLGADLQFFNPTKEMEIRTPIREILLRFLLRA